ncbi:glycoside hydrolase superfamily [Xylariomycetidae sp. FL0641]|nr:glycoside hydrolase superfamily [Xylariomycetidae sp. FL0641]
MTNRRNGLLMALTGLASCQTTAAAAAASTNSIDIPTDLKPRVLLPDVVGYSVEPIWLDAYISTPLMATLLQTIKDETGAAPGVRVGGNTADATYIHSSLPTGNSSVALPALPDATTFNITPSWFGTWADYFPAGTPLTYTLNLAVNDSDFAVATAQARAAHAALGPKLARFEFGNEIDHYSNKGWRGPGWDVAQYTGQFRDILAQLAGSDWFRAAGNSTTGGGAPKIQAGVFADPPWVPDQQDEIDDFSIANLTAGGLLDDPLARAHIADYAVHLYPQSTCDAARWQRMRLDLLSDHLTLVRNLSQFGPQVTAAEAAGASLVLGETNSVSCGGRSGISDTFGAALWAADYALLAASVGLRRVYFHLGAQSEYAFFTPQGPYRYANETLLPGIRPAWYAHYFVAQVVKGGEELGVAALPAANASDLAGYAVYAPGTKNGSSGSSSSSRVAKLVFLDMGVWNGTQGLGNNSTLAATDGTTFSAGARPGRTLAVATPWCPGRGVAVTRLQAPGTNAKSEVAVSGVRFDARTGEILGEKVQETLTVGRDGTLEVTMRRAEAVLLEVAAAAEGCAGAGGGAPGTVPDSAAAAPAPGSAAAESAQNNAATSGSQQATGAGVNTGAGTTREKTQAELEADRAYEEAMEEEYAKREGGA